MRDTQASAVENSQVADSLWRIVLELDEAFPEPLPGQFVNLRFAEGTDPLLRRPFSVYSFQDGEPPLLGILYSPIGRWTRRLASAGVGARLNVLGPLGNPFTPGSEEVSVLVGGGRGVAPLIFLARRLAASGKKLLSLVGARIQGDIFTEGPLRDGASRFITEDGSSGRRGLVTELLDEHLASSAEGTYVYCCGPTGMLRKVSEICARYGVGCQASVETVFACGLGVCKGCSVPPASPGAPYLTACSDGPVLRAEEVDWERFAP